MSWKQKWINPVLEKEFRLRMRSFRAPLALMLYLFVIGVLALGFMLVMMQGMRGTSLDPDSSRALFYFLSGLQLVLITFMIPGMTAGAISGEREKQTLGMLLTTQQSSAAIILSKLTASISFMLLIVFATMPIYSIVFLYGGISPLELISVFLFYIFVMFVLGALGIFFSTFVGKTVVAIIASYGVTLFIYGFTALAAIFGSVLIAHDSFVVGILLALNPMAGLISIFQPEFSRQLWPQSNWQLWQVFVVVYAAIAVVAILLSIRSLRPLPKKRALKVADDPNSAGDSE